MDIIFMSDWILSESEKLNALDSLIPWIIGFVPGTFYMIASINSSLSESGIGGIIFITDDFNDMYMAISGF